MKRLVLVMIALASVLPLGLAAVHRVHAVEELCKEFASQPEAQAFLTDNPSMADSLDPDGNGVACESLLPAGATAVATTNPATAAPPPPAATAAPEATSTPEGTVAPDALDARLGSTRKAFETRYGRGLGADDATQDPNAARYKLSGYRVARVFYQDDRVLIVILVAKRPVDAPRDEPAVGDWSVKKADELAKRFLPTDVTSGKQLRQGNRILVPCQSPALAAALTTAAYEQSGAAGKPGDCRYLFLLSGEDRVSTIYVTIGDQKRGAAVPRPTETPEADAG